MLSLTRKSDYALVAMAELARRAPQRTSAREISKSVRIPLPVMTNILHQLLRHELVTSTMGSKGGYCLAKRPEQINLAQMIEAIEGPITLTVCNAEKSNGQRKRCDLEPTCRIKKPVHLVHLGLQRFFSRITLAHLAFDTVSIGMESTAGTSAVGEETAETLC